MFSLSDLRFVLCSRDLDLPRAQRIIGFYLNYPQINGVVTSGHVESIFVFPARSGGVSTVVVGWFTGPPRDARQRKQIQPYPAGSHHGPCQLPSIHVVLHEVPRTAPGWVMTTLGNFLHFDQRTVYIVLHEGMPQVNSPCRLCFKVRLNPSLKLVLFTCKWTKICVWIKLISIWKASH